MGPQEVGWQESPRRQEAGTPVSASLACMWSRGLSFSMCSGPRHRDLFLLQPRPL